MFRHPSAKNRPKADAIIRTMPPLSRTLTPKKRIAILNASGQTDYLYGLVSGLASLPHLEIDVIDSEKSKGLFDAWPNVRHYNFVGGFRHDKPAWMRAWRVPRYYLSLLLYSCITPARVFHIQWLGRLPVLERFLWLTFYKMLRKQIVFTAHNIDPLGRESGSGFLGRLSLRWLYRMADRIIVHANCMKQELMEGYKTPAERITILPIGINNYVPERGISREEARKRLGIAPDRKALLFFGRINRSKGVDVLLESLALLVREDPSYCLRIAGFAYKNNAYKHFLEDAVRRLNLAEHVAMEDGFIPTEEIETYLAASDCVVLPYRRIFHSAVLLLAYRFGLPVVATATGGLAEDVFEGETGFLCRPEAPADLADAIRRFFNSPLYRERGQTRKKIAAFARENYGWEKIGEKTAAIYEELDN